MNVDPTLAQQLAQIEARLLQLASAGNYNPDDIIRLTNELNTEKNKILQKMKQIQKDQESFTKSEQNTLNNLNKKIDDTNNVAA